MAKPKKRYMTWLEEPPKIVRQCQWTYAHARHKEVVSQISAPCGRIPTSMQTSMPSIMLEYWKPKLPVEPVLLYCPWC